MKTLLPAVVLGMLLGAGLMLALPGDTPPEPERPRDSLHHPSTTEPDPGQDTVWEVSGTPVQESAHTEGTPFPPGTALLSIGDAYVFGEDQAQPGAEGEPCDLLCLDLRETASLYCPGDAEAALLPPARAEGAPLPKDAFRMLVDAPDQLRSEVVELRREAHEDESGVALIRAGDGLVYKVVAEEFFDDQHALRRKVRLRYARVPQQPGGGVVPVPGGIGSSRVDPDVAAKLRPLFQAPAEIHPSRGAGEVPGNFIRLGEIPDTFEITQRGAYLLPRTLRSKLELGVFIPVYLKAGVAREAVIEAGTFSRVVLEGEMAGRIVSDGGYVRIRGDLTGTLVTNGTVVIDGDLLGTIELSGIPQVLIKGTVRDPTTAFKCEGGIPSIYIGGYTDRNQVMSFRKQPGIWSLSLAESDIPEGRHRGIAWWSEVRVGEEFWEKLLR